MDTLAKKRQRDILNNGEHGFVNGNWNLAEKNMRSSPYADFEPFDAGYDDIESHRGKPVFGVEEDGQTFFDFPFVQNPSRKPDSMTIAHHTGGKHFTEPTGPELIQDVLNDPTLDESDYKRILGPDYKNKIQQSQQQSLLISGGPFTGGGYMTNDGFGVNLRGDVYRQNRDGSFDYIGPYTEDRFGPLIPGGGPDIDLASHDNPQFKSVPATGTRGDTMAPDWLIDYMNRKDENLFQIQDRLKRV